MVKKWALVAECECRNVLVFFFPYPQLCIWWQWKVSFLLAARSPHVDTWEEKKKKKGINIAVFFICIHCGLSLAWDFCLFLNAGRVKPCGLATVCIVYVGIIKDKLHSSVCSLVSSCSLVACSLWRYELSVIFFPKNFWRAQSYLKQRLDMWKYGAIILDLWNITALQNICRLLEMAVSWYTARCLLLQDYKAWSACQSKQT